MTTKNKTNFELILKLPLYYNAQNCFDHFVQFLHVHCPVVSHTGYRTYLFTFWEYLSLNKRSSLIACTSQSSL